MQHDNSTANAHPPSEADARYLSSINNAIQNGELVLHFQPRFNTDKRRSSIVEALVRWDRPGVGLLYPELFLPVSERHGLIFNLDMWVFEQCCKDLRWFRVNVDPGIRIAVNVSVLECESIYFVQKLISLCEQYDHDFSGFEFEITEGTHARDSRKVLAFCETLGNLGATFSLDDFGTGQSSLTNICQLPVELIKIDKNFVHNAGSDDRTRIMVEHLVIMANNMGLQSVAEGIEDQRQLDIMMDIGCDQLQGYFLSRPDDKTRLNFEF